MVRVSLRDDPLCCGATVGLDDDLRPVNAGLSDDPNQPPPVDVLPRVSIRDREGNGYDDLGNPRWVWVDRVTDASAVMWEQREEVDDRAGTTLIKARTTVLYPPALPPLRETASVRTSDGNVWSVTALDRFPDRVTVQMERVDDGP